MDENERWTMVCEPTLKRIEDGVNKLNIVVISGNGKPSLVSRMETIEREAETGKAGQRSRSVELGPLKLNGYAMSDVLKVAILCALVWGAWLIISDKQERMEVLKEIRTARHTDGRTAGQ